LCFEEKIEVSAAEQMPVGTSLPEEPSEKQVEKIPVYPVGVGVCATAALVCAVVWAVKRKKR
jgi:hypothetical protein